MEWKAMETFIEVHILSTEVGLCFLIFIRNDWKRHLNLRTDKKSLVTKIHRKILIVHWVCTVHSWPCNPLRKQKRFEEQKKPFGEALTFKNTFTLHFGMS